MTEELFQLSGMHWCIVIVAAFIVGFSKTGIAGAGILAVPLFAIVFDSNPAFKGVSPGILLPILCMADVIAVWYYKRHVEWKHLWPLMPWVAVGIFAAFFMEKYIPSRDWLNPTIGIIVLIVLILSIVLEKKKDEVPKNPGIAVTTGVSAGFTTMLANAAGPIMNIYLLVKRLPKNSFVGTGAWYFMIVNLFKVPLMYNLGKINMHSFIFDLKMLPAIILGGIAGIYTVKWIPEKGFKVAVQVLTFLAALKIIFS